MSQGISDAGPIAGAATHVAIMGLLGWLGLVLFSSPWSDSGNQSNNQPASSGDSASSGDTESPLMRIEINAADASELGLLPSIGPNMASRILAYRERHGDFQSWSELANISGMGPLTMATIAPYCQIDPVVVAPPPETLAHARSNTR